MCSNLGGSFQTNKSTGVHRHWGLHGESNIGSEIQQKDHWPRGKTITKTEVLAPQDTIPLSLVSSSVKWE